MSQGWKACVDGAVRLLADLVVVVGEGIRYGYLYPLSLRSGLSEARYCLNVLTTRNDLRSMAAYQSLRNHLLAESAEPTSNMSRLLRHIITKTRDTGMTIHRCCSGIPQRTSQQRTHLIYSERKRGWIAKRMKTIKN